MVRLHFKSVTFAPMAFALFTIFLVRVCTFGFGFGFGSVPLPLPFPFGFGLSGFPFGGGSKAAGAGIGWTAPLARSIGLSTAAKLSCIEAKGHHLGSLVCSDIRMMAEVVLHLFRHDILNHTAVPTAEQFPILAMGV